LLIGFASEDDWLDYQLENDPRFLRRIQQARERLREGCGTRIEDIEWEHINPGSRLATLLLQGIQVRKRSNCCRYLLDGISELLCWNNHSLLIG